MKKSSKEGFARDLDRLKFAMNAAGIGVWELDTVTNTVDWDHRCGELFGLDHKYAIPYEEVVRLVHPDDVNGVHEAVQAALRGENDGAYEATYRTIGANDGQLRWVNFSGAAYFDKAGQVTRFGGVARDVTTQMTVQQQLKESEDKLLGVIAAAPAAIGLFIGRDLVIQHPNQTFIDIVGKGPGVDGLPLREAMPELITEGQPFLQILDDVYTKGIPFHSPASMVKIVQNGVLTDNYYNISYTPLRNAQNEVYGILDIAIDVTELVKTQQQLAAKTAELEASEARFRQLIREAPVATCLFVGRGLRVEIANEPMLAMWGKGPDVVGKTLAEVLPELVGQPYLDILDRIFITGETFSATGMEAQLVRDGVKGTYYFDFTYKPLRDLNGHVYAIMDMAVDVTASVRARQAIEQSEKKLVEAVDLAELGTWSFDVARQRMTYSPRMQAWYGFESAEVGGEDIMRRIVDSDRERFVRAFQGAANGQDAGMTDSEHTITNRITGQRHTLHSVGKPVLDANGQVLRIEGTTRDVTTERNLQAALEHEVKKRTEELQSTIEALHETNTALHHSNEELAQYAYVASHDLQEPLRKIQVFSGMLGSDVAVTPRNKDLLQKINSSSARMAALIRDLLEFSRLLKSQNHFGMVHLNKVLADVVTDFELVAQEKSATFHISELPVVAAVGLQMNQLFSNLIGNALKFTRPGVPPEIRVTAALLRRDEIAPFIRKPLPAAQYYRICIADNGIGFDNVYSNQIFEVFKRLHGRDIYPGSGIGLALCRRIAANHNGYLTTTSVPGKGTTFCLILPDKQD